MTIESHTPYKSNESIHLRKLYINQAKVGQGKEP